jgi:hypothetical protein
MGDIAPNDDSAFSSIDEDSSTPIKEMMETVADVIMPRVENRPRRGGGSTPSRSGGGSSRTPSSTGRTPPSTPSRSTPGGSTPSTAAPTKPKPGQKTDIGTPQKKDKATTPADKAARAKAAKDKADAAGKAGNMAGLAALGITAAAATALIAAALASFVASDGAHIKFVSITGEKKTSDAVPSALANIVQSVAPTVTTLEVTWELLEVGNPGGIASAVKIIEDDLIEWKNTGLEKLDGTDVKVVRIKSDNVFIVESKLTDSSQINLVDTGDGYIHTSYDDQLNQSVDEAAGGLADLANKATGGLAGKIGTIIAIVIGVILVVVIVGLILKFMNSKKAAAASNTSNTPN